MTIVETKCTRQSVVYVRYVVMMLTHSLNKSGRWLLTAYEF